SWSRLLAKEDPDNRMLADIRDQVRDGRKDLKKAQKECEKGEEQLADGRRQYKAGRAVQAATDDTTFGTDEGYALPPGKFDRDVQSVDSEVKEQIPQLGEQLSRAGVSAEYSVEITQENTLVGPGEVIGLIIAAIVLLIALGTVVAAGLPIG